MRVAVVGAGAIGGYVGACMTESGHDVVLVDPWPEHVETLRAGGVRLYGMDGSPDRAIPVRALHLTDVQSLIAERPIDVAFIATKSYDTSWATMLIRPYLSSAGCCVSLQNCINEDRIAEAVGWGRTLGCVVAGGVGVDLYEAGKIRRGYAKDPTSTSFFVGEPHGRITERAHQIAELIHGAGTATVTANLWGERWSKLTMNGMRNAVSAATGMSGNERDSDPDVRRVCVRLGGEALKVGDALGYAVDKVGKFGAADLKAAADGNAGAMARVEDVMTAGTSTASRSRYQRPSMAQDIAKGRRTEIDDMNGFIAAQGATVGVPTPTHDLIADLVRKIEKGQLKPDRELLFS